MGLGISWRLINYIFIRETLKYLFPFFSSRPDNYRGNPSGQTHTFFNEI